MKFKCFTLPEVLVTLGIVGIVAAMTIPNLAKAYQKRATVNKLKSTYAILQQAIKLSEAENGTIDGWAAPTSYAWDNNDIQYNGGKEIAEKYLLPYLQTIIPDCGKQIPNKCLPEKRYYSNQVEYSYNITHYAFVLKNGVAVTAQPTAGGINMTLYLNGKSSRAYGKDIFRLIIFIDPSAEKTWATQCFTKPGFYFFGQGCDRNYLKNGYVPYGNAYGCNNDKNKREPGMLCGAMIIQDGWKISDDYPW